MTDKFENAQAEIEKCHEQISRQANINHAQAKQIEEMSQQLDGVAATQKEIHEKTKIQIQQYQNEIDIREMEINRLKKLLEQKDNECLHLNTQIKMQADRLTDIEDELEMKSGENNRLRKQVADLESAMQDLYHSRKGNGSLQIELDSLKADNERLLDLLRGTCEYADMDDAQIIAMSSNGQSKASKLVSRMSGSGKQNLKGTTTGGGAKAIKNNDWIPTQAVHAILKIKEQFNGVMSETCISQILYELNAIWRNIMRKECEAIKKRLSGQIQDLRRSQVAKQAFDKSELVDQINRTKKELNFANKQIYNTKISAEGAGGVTNEREQIYAAELENSMKLVETIGIQKKNLEKENVELKSRLSEMVDERSNYAGDQRQGIPSLNFASG